MNNLRRVGQERGFTLVEMMVAMSLGLILLLGVSMMFITATRASSRIKEMSSVDVQGNDAMTVLADEFGNAGYVDLIGCAAGNDSVCQGDEFRVSALLLNDSSATKTLMDVAVSRNPYYLMGENVPDVAGGSSGGAPGGNPGGNPGGAPGGNPGGSPSAGAFTFAPGEFLRYGYADANAMKADFPGKYTGRVLSPMQIVRRVNKGVGGAGAGAPGAIDTMLPIMGCEQGDFAVGPKEMLSGVQAQSCSSGQGSSLQVAYQVKSGQAQRQSSAPGSLPSKINQFTGAGYDCQGNQAPDGENFLVNQYRFVPGRGVECRGSYGDGKWSLISPNVDDFSLRYQMTVPSFKRVDDWRVPGSAAYKFEKNVVAPSGNRATSYLTADVVERSSLSAALKGMLDAGATSVTYDPKDPNDPSKAVTYTYAKEREHISDVAKIPTTVGGQMDRWNFVTAVEVCMVVADFGADNSRDVDLVKGQPTLPTCRIDQNTRLYQTKPRQNGDQKYYRRFVRTFTLPNLVYATPASLVGE